MAEWIGVVGAGTMGNGIAHVFARAGFDVWMTDVSSAAGDKGLATIKANLAREVSKGKLTSEAADEALARVKVTTDLGDLAACALVVEAATERFTVKAEVFRRLDQMLASDAVLASNTSSISITKLAGLTKRPAKVIGMHFFNPVPVMRLVEVIRGLQTSDETYARVRTMAEQVGKLPVEVNDAAGFVSNRVLMPLINEAVLLR